MRTFFLSDEEHKALEEERGTKVRAFPDYERLAKEGWSDELHKLNDSVIKPGAMWYCPWIWDPEVLKDPEHPDYAWMNERIARANTPENKGFLSVHYLTDWARIRPPICVKCPDGSEWLVDQKSSNGTGWVVTGEVPNITCSPSIVVTGYHGFLQNGEFTPDLDHGQGPDGVPHWLARRGK